MTLATTLLFSTTMLDKYSLIQVALQREDLVQVPGLKAK